MLVISISEFEKDIQKYLKLAYKERVALRSDEGVLELTPSGETFACNPSPSNDPWFDDPENLRHINSQLERLHSGRMELVSWEETRKKLGL